MYRMRRTLTIFFVICSAVVCASAQLELSEKNIEAIRRVKESYRNSWLKGDDKAILRLFTDGARLYPNGLDPIVGKEAIAKFWFSPGNSKTVINEYKIEIDEIFGKKSLALSTGSTAIKWTTTNKMTGEVKLYRSKGLFMTVFVKEKKTWKIIKHIWNGKFEEIK